MGSYEYLSSLYNIISESDKLLNPPNGGDKIMSSPTFSNTTIDNLEYTLPIVVDGYLAIVIITGIIYSSTMNSFLSVIYFSN